MKILVTGAGGLVGGEAVEYFTSQGHVVVGIDNNQREEFFGAAGSTRWNIDRLRRECSNSIFIGTDIRDRIEIKELFGVHKFDAVIHCAAQPSHDKAKEIPLIDFDVNAVGTLNLLENARQTCPEAPFVFMSTNKVYGDAPNEELCVELETRYEYGSYKKFRGGIDESCRIDQSTHSVFGASKVAADVMVQEYGRYFKMPTVCFRGGCLTGPNHSGVELHGFLSYLGKQVVRGGEYIVYGYKGKQVRDNIHSFDVVRAMDVFIQHPRIGEVYNLGGGYSNSISILEAIKEFESRVTRTGFRWMYKDEPRVGDHICYYSDMTKFESHYAQYDWHRVITLPMILNQIADAEERRLRDAIRASTPRSSYL